MGLNSTIEKINESIEPEEIIDKTGTWLNNFDWKKPLDWIGEKVTHITGNIVSKSSENGFELGVFSFKIVILLLFCLVLYFETKIQKKVLKVILIILSVLLIASITISFFV